VSERKTKSAWCDEPDAFCPPLTVYETAPETVDTGLLDASGTKIFRRPLVGRIGFDMTPRSQSQRNRRTRA
jgi:hypothetical protein